MMLAQIAQVAIQLFDALFVRFEAFALEAGGELWREGGSVSCRQAMYCANIGQWGTVRRGKIGSKRKSIGGGRG